MKKRKLRFNIIDLLIILLIVAAVVVAAKFLIDRSNSAAGPENKTVITYVVEFINIEERFSNSVQAGDSVQYEVKKVDFGTVVGVQSSPYQQITFNYDEKVETVSTIEDKITLSVTIEAEVEESDRGFSRNGSDIRVGQPYSLNFPNFAGTGYCVKVTEQ
ncbi:MAG: DUF4330 family protein [Lachnospiraceae bacterium]|nr:DUF4330 family protein [Lachnospiraceae bacterium]